MGKFIFKTPSELKKKLYKTTPKKTEEKKLSFCFEYSSMKKGHLCFDNPLYEPSDIIELIKCLKNISKYSLKEIFDNDQVLHFHEVELKHKAFLNELYVRTITYEGERSQLPHLFQLEVFTDHRRNIAPRITFFILSDCVAKIVYFDYHHLLCSKVYGKSKEIPENWFEHYID